MLRRSVEEPPPAAQRYPATILRVDEVGDSLAFVIRLTDHRGRKLELPYITGRECHGGTRLVRALRACGVAVPATDKDARKLDVRRLLVGKSVDAELRRDIARSGGGEESPSVYAIYRSEEPAQ